MSQSDGRPPQFIALFVNNMYVVVLSLGIGHVVFDGDLSSNRGFPATSVSFVASVVLFYWWKWAQIEKLISTSWREFLVDSLILAVFFLMFKFHDCPPALASLLAGLAALDCWWVVNFCRENTIRASFWGAENAARWYRHKILAIFIFGLTCGGLWYGRERLSSRAWTELLVLVPIAILVSWMCFRIKVPPVLVRPAKEGDIPGIVRTHNMWALEKDRDMSESGFLLERISRETIKQNLAPSGDKYHGATSTSYYVATSVSGELLGYGALSLELPPEIEEVRWESDEFRGLALGREQCHVLDVAVKPGETGKGVAQEIYSALYKHYNDAVISAFVVTAPVKNYRSLDFHDRQDFQHVGTFSRDEFRGLKDYESHLLARFPDPDSSANQTGS